MSTDPEQALRHAIWEQVWSHSRHLETVRSQYLGFFFTAALAVTAIAAKDLADHGLRTTGSLIAFSALMLGLDVLAAFLLIAVRRINEVLEAYRRVVFANITEILGEDAASRPKWARLPDRTQSYLGSTRGAAEAVLYAALAVFLFALGGGAARAVDVGGSGAIAVCSAGFVLGLIVCAASIRMIGLPPIASKRDDKTAAQAPGDRG